MIRILIGSGRSGTTWLLDSIARENQLRPIFEPLHPCVSPLARSYQNFLLEESASADELRDFILKSSTGAVCPIWTRFRTRPDLLFTGLIPDGKRPEIRQFIYRWAQFTRRLTTTYYWSDYQDALVKLIRANLMVAWMKKHIDSKILYVIRNPFDVVASQLEHIEHWAPDPTLKQLYNNSLISDRFSSLKYIASNKSAKTAEKLALIWGIQNKIGLEQCRSVEIPVVNYDDLINYKADCWDTVASALAVKLPRVDQLVKPSQQAWTKPRNIKQKLSRLDREQIQVVLAEIGLEQYS